MELTDFQITHHIFTMWRHSSNMELRNIALCAASKYRFKWTIEFEQELHKRIKTLVREGKLARRKFLPGRPFYCPY